MNIKQRLFIITIIALFSINLSSCDKSDESDLNPKHLYLLTNDKSWYVIYHNNSCPGFDCTFTYLYSIGRDTLINNIQYKEILETSGKESPIHTETYGYARETNDKKVYLLKNDIERLYYDFNIKIFDTVNNWQLIDIETIEISNIIRKKLFLKSICTSDSTYWIEGIGSIDGLFYQDNFKCMDSLIINFQGGSIYELNCVYENEINIFESGRFNDCWVFEPYEE